MSRRSYYSRAVAWLAHRAAGRGLEDLRELESVQLVAFLWGRTADVVAFEVLQHRNDGGDGED